METEVYNAAVNGDINIFRNKNHEHLLKKTNQNNNIIHIAAQHQQLDFIKAALNSFPSTPTCKSLLCDQNRHGNTPLHIASQVRSQPLIVQLYDFYSTQCSKDNTSGVLPWRMVNSDGNTPAHVALIYGNASVAMYLIDKDDYVARVLNRSKETLLHLAIQYHNFDNESQIPETQAISSSEKVYKSGEEIQPIIELLLKRVSSVACWTDTDGSTPLHRATSLHPPYCIPVIKAILAICPEAAEVQHERTNHTVLHLLTKHQVASYEQGLELLKIPQVYALRNIKDHQGDTPLHLAATNKDTIMVRVLLSSSPHLGMKNKSGVSAGSLVRQLEQMRSRETLVQHKRKLTKEECEAALQGNVAFLKEKLVSLGITFLGSHTSKGGNILHLLLKYIFNKNNSTEKIGEAEELVGEAIQMLPSLISQQDRDGDTLVHLIVNTRYFSSEILNIICKYFQKEGEDGIHLRPWRLKNVNGDMPLHVAIKVENYEAALQLLEMDEEVADYTINRNQNPLHLISDHNVPRPRMLCYIDNREKLMKGLVNVNAELPYMQDEDCLTPLLIAVQRRNIPAIKFLYSGFPDCRQIADFKGRTYWHLSVSRPAEDDSFSYLIYELTADDELLMKRKDNDGNTPLHLAIKNRHFDFAQFFLDYCAINRVPKTIVYRSLLSIENKEGVSCYNLIGSADHLPNEFERNLFYTGNLLSGHRSKYGVPTTKMEAYTNTIGVIAALLATITFTAAFAVPGGLDSSNGTPFFLRKAVFQVFLVADVVAMCSSMMVLFCLLWIMTTANKANSISLLDISVFLLQTSLHATMVTFMTGLYVTTNSIAPAIAISTCVACTLLIILMHKGLVMLTVVPVLEILIILGQFAKRLLNILSKKVRESLFSLWISIKTKCCG